jgi:hypothetical protein
VLRIPGPRGDEIVSDWGKSHNEELHNFPSLPNIIRIINKGKWHGSDM